MLADATPMRETLGELASALDALKALRAGTLLERYGPYPKQAAFHAAGEVHRERLFMAANQVGKTFAGACEVAMHATGRYPQWWSGRRFDRPTRWWVAGVTAEATRDNPQRLLLGPPGVEAEGSGVVPAHDVVSRVVSRSAPGAVDGVRVRHIGGGESWIGFKSYAQGREKWQGETLDGVWFDEEPPDSIYAEGLTRTNATGGLVFLTFTPLLGMSGVVSRFLTGRSPDRAVIQMGLTEAGHYDAEQAARIAASYGEGDRAARARGEPSLGSGRVFTIPEDRIRCEPFTPPAHWAQIAALDFGWDHPTAAVRLAWDRDHDAVYVMQAYRARQRTPSEHAEHLRVWGAIAFAWPQDGLQHEKGSGQPLAAQFQKAGLSMLAKPATFPDGGVSVEAGVLEMIERLRAGRLKIFAGLDDWFSEYRLYHRKEGRIVKERDDLLSATRYGLMALRHASPLTRPLRPAFADDRYGYGGRDEH